MRNPGHLPIPEQTISLPALDFTVSAVLYEAAGNVITRPTNPQDFKLCAAVGQVGGLVKLPTKVQYAYQHSRGFSQQVEVPVDPVDLNHPQVCRTIEGLEIGEYVDVTLTVDPANTRVESNESNNIHTFRVTR